MKDGPSDQVDKPVTLSAAISITGYGKTRLRMAFDTGEVTGRRAPGPSGIDYRFFDRTSLAQWAAAHPRITRFDPAPGPSPDVRTPLSPEPTGTNSERPDGEALGHTDDSRRLDTGDPAEDLTGPREPTAATTLADPAAENVALRVVIDALLDALVEEADSRHRGLQAIRTAFRGLDGARPPIIAADLLDQLRDVRLRGI